MKKKSEKRVCQNCKQDFTIETEDFNFYEKIHVPPPTFCPECRFQKRLLFRNNRVFYKRECALCGESLLATYNKERPYTIYCRDCWLSDKWDPLSYGKDYDFAVPFFSQFRSLQSKVPRVNLYRTNFINSDYCNYGLDYKECYLLFGGKNNERIYFGNQILDSRDSMDVAFSEKLELCYENFECARNNRLFFSSYSTDCVDSAYLINCRNCMNCFGCVNLVNQQYHLFNQPVSKEKYDEFVKKNTGSYQKHLENLKKLRELELSIPHRYARIYKSVNSDGDDLMEVKNTHDSYSTRQAEDSRYLFFCRHESNYCYDTTFQGYKAEFLYEVAHGFAGSRTSFSVRNHYNQDAFYCEECRECKNIFGCEGLTNKQYCILNKQYTKEEYEKLVPEIKKHMEEMPYFDKKGRVYKFGDFFPAELSPFAYNESIAQEYFPLSKEKVLENGLLWKEPEERNYQTDLKTEELPDSIKDTEESIVGKVIECAHSGKCMEQCTEAFKIVPEEFKFYKRMNLPLPRLCPNCRHFGRINQRNPTKLWHRKCMKEGCKNEFETSYAPDRPEIVYCEKCYQAEVY